jgi:hypothetical protein
MEVAFVRGGLALSLTGNGMGSSPLWPGTHIFYTYTSLLLRGDYSGFSYIYIFRFSCLRRYIFPGFFSAIHISSISASYKPLLVLLRGIPLLPPSSIFFFSVFLSSLIDHFSTGSTFIVVIPLGFLGMGHICKFT